MELVTLTLVAVGCFLLLAYLVEAWNRRHS